MKHILMVFSTMIWSGKYQKYHEVTHFWTHLQTSLPGEISKWNPREISGKTHEFKGLV